MITAITGPPSSGKTYWIREQIAEARNPVCYFSPETDRIPIDSIWIKSEFPQVQVLRAGEEDKIIATTEAESMTYIELPWYLDLAAIEPFLQQFNCHRVAVMPLAPQNTGWHNWADEVIVGNLFETGNNLESINYPLLVHRGLLAGEILDFASLEVFWSELTQNAYGQVIRAKGIFEISNGHSVYGEFLQTLPHQEFQVLNLPLWLKGRPQRFSGFEIVGRNLDQAVIAQTIKDCCIPESAINNYQQQVKENLEKKAIL